MIEPYVEFERGMGKDHEHVCARVFLPLGIVLELWSEEVRSERRWEIEEVTLDPTDGRGDISLTLTPGRRMKLLDCELVAFVRREWDLEVARERRREAAAVGQEALHV